MMKNKLVVKLILGLSLVVSCFAVYAQQTDEQLAREWAKKANEISWLKLNSQPLTGEAFQIYKDDTKEIGFVHYGNLLFTQLPDYYVALSKSFAALQKDSGLTDEEIEFIAVIVSVENRCAVCAYSHSAYLREITHDPVFVTQLNVDYRHFAKLTPRQRAIADYSRQITLAPADINEDTIKDLRTRGLTDKDIFAVALVASSYNFYNRVFSATGTQPNPEYPTLWVNPK